MDRRRLVTFGTVVLGAGIMAAAWGLSRHGLGRM